MPGTSKAARAGKMLSGNCAIDAAFVGVLWHALSGQAKFGLQQKVFQRSGRKLPEYSYVAVGRQSKEFNRLCRAGSLGTLEPGSVRLSYICRTPTARALPAD